MSLLDKIQKDMVDAMKAKDEARLSTVRLIKTALKKQEVDSMKPLIEATEMQVMNTLIKQRRESADMFRKGGREDAAVKEEAEIVLIESYLPAVASEADVQQAVSEAITETGASSAKQMGAVMKAAQARLVGKRVDGKVLSEFVKQKLG
ncbi:MAG: GatB/YqeY domain-containing protein [Acidobacteriota bacterium]|nr:GatB/YqeY domain-containing protein [Acidobacteriota bacterium]